MPFDGTEAKFVKPEVFSLEGLVAWLEQQEPQAQYEWTDCAGACLIGQYMASQGARWSFRGYLDCLTLPQRLAIASERPRTYAAALSRARQLLATA